MGYHHFSIAERGQLDALYRLKWTTRQIAVHLGRHHSTIAREFRRGRQADGYDATHAHRSAAQRRQGACPKGKHTPLLADEITHRLQHTWSPAQIAAYHRMHNYPSVSFKTIYRWLYRMQLYPAGVTMLRHKGKRRQPQSDAGNLRLGRPFITAQQWLIHGRHLGIGKPTPWFHHVAKVGRVSPHLSNARLVGTQLLPCLIVRQHR